MKRLIVLTLILAMVILSFTACGTLDQQATVSEESEAVEAPADTSADAESDETLTVGVLYCILSAPAVKVFSEGIQEQAAEMNVELIELDGEWNAQKQTDQINSLISQGVDAILLNPVDNKSIIPAVKKAYEAGIPVVMGAMNIDESGKDYVVSYVGADEKDVGLAAGQMMIDALGEEGGKVLIVEGVAGTDPQRFRTEGFEEAIAGTNIVVAEKLAGDFDKAKALTVTEDALTRMDDVAGIWVHDDTMCIGVVQAIKAMGYESGEIKVVSYNGSAAGAEMVKNGEIYGTAVQPLNDEGKRSLLACVMAANGEKVEEWYKDIIEPITAENVDSYDPALLW